ncbi:RXLR effector family protein, putative [Phytophthora infestans T30-4]|uniref:RXLR effector family protein, putative n=1 Tax=Phytophthora infestans (strain T30-4) TaxID=403677 RepID=D0NBY0_PHYIT|nr:RXLR effector family protein, putative [Phytophthora infestans T30-4]EEY55285.1 RXLR effector family protein, putative [Phytophthora infestans T30-4]|eukprot:XP_002903509.1 RXLR effector family protein, putative [Phytophthora infestans T30-4]
MHLNKAGSELFSNPQFSPWVQYVDDLSKLSKKEVSAVSTLIVSYGDTRLYEMIEKAKTISQTKALATKLEAEQMRHWVTTRKNPEEIGVGHLDQVHSCFQRDIPGQEDNNVRDIHKDLEAWLSSGKSVEDVFDLLRLNLTKDDFFKNPVLSIWVSYLNTIVTDNPNKMSEVLSFLKTRFTTTPLLRTLAKAKQFGKRSY